MLLKYKYEITILYSGGCRNTRRSHKVHRLFVYTGKNNGFPFLDILGYLKNTHKNPKFGKVRQVPIREFSTKFPNWDLSHSSKNWESVIFPVLDQRGKRSTLFCLQYKNSCYRNLDSRVFVMFNPFDSP